MYTTKTQLRSNSVGRYEMHFSVRFRELGGFVVQLSVLISRNTLWKFFRLGFA